MSRVHDMGGRFGDGPIPEIEMEELFHADWEKRALALNLATGALRQWNIDASRHSRERLSPKDYSKFSYFEKWISALADLLVERGVLTEDELKHPDAKHQISKLAENALHADQVQPAMERGGPSLRDAGPEPLFKVGDAVRTSDHSTNSQVAGGHTRLPQYAMGRVGRIVQLHGNHVLPDSNAHFAGENPEPLYAVEFDAETLWGNTAEDCDDTMVLDLWQSYLNPVNT